MRLAVYHGGAEVLPANLGPNWRNVVRGWPEEARLNFVVELAHNPWLADNVEEIALADPSPKVRWNAAHMLSWYGFLEKWRRPPKSLDDVSLSEVLQQRGQTRFRIRSGLASWQCTSKGTRKRAILSSDCASFTLCRRSAERTSSKE